MRLIASALCLVFAVALVAAVSAAEEKQVTLEGNITCAKCELNKEKACATVIVVKKDGKDVIYYFDDKAHKEHHAKICTEGKKGKVTGTLSKKNGKEIITVTKVEFN